MCTRKSGASVSHTSFFPCQVPALAVPSCARYSTSHHGVVHRRFQVRVTELLTFLCYQRAALFVQVAVNAEQPAGPQAASVPAVPSDEKNAGNEVTENPAMPPVLEDVIESMEGGISAIHSVEDRLQKDLEMMMSVEKELRDNGALNSAAGEEPLIEGASAGSVITMILKRMRDDTAAMKSMMVKEMDDIRRMVNYDTSVTSRIMQLFPAVDIQGTLEAMKGAVTQQMELLQTILGSGANLPNSIL